jgi:hypothetical protein
VAVPISFNLLVGPPVTTTTTFPTTTTTITGNCTSQAATATASPTRGSATATVSPATCLVNGSTATITVTGLMPASASTSLGTFIECNDDPDQATVAILGNNIPVSCSPALKYIFTPNAAGTASMPSPNNQPSPLPAFSVIEGTVGPACAPSLCGGTSTDPSPDSAGGNPYIDAAKYPCPPTSAQEAAGDTCVISVGDTGGDQVVVPITFNPDVAPPTPASKRQGTESRQRGGTSRH